MKQIITLLALLIFPFFVSSQDREADSLTLVSIYQSLDGENWQGYDKWLTEAPLEEWKGIGIQNDRINKLELKLTSSSDINGTFPLQILDLSELTTLEFTELSINEPIPAILLQLTKLNRIVFKYCNLTGELPQIFDQFNNLKTLILSFNELTGTLPALPQNMNLAYIDRNQFSGEIPSSWSGNEMSSLQIHGNNLTGNYDILNTMPNLTQMTISNNNWDEATLPTWIDERLNLIRFECDGCNITGEIPSDMDFSALQNYSGMFLSDNQLSGDISLLFNNPEFGKKLYLRARNNNFSGELPVHKIISFSRFDVYNNKYTSLTEPIEGVEYDLNVQYNNFTFESLQPLQQYIALDSIIEVTYRNQNSIETVDTIYVTEPMIVTLDALDAHPNTTYQWYKGNQSLTEETSKELSIDVTAGMPASKYSCRMENLDFPELNLRTEETTIITDINTSISKIEKVIVNVGPNPVNDLLHIYDIDNKDYQYSISSLNGIIIRKGFLLNAHTINVSDLASGSYFLTLNTDTHVFTQKIIKL